MGQQYFQKMGFWAGIFGTVQFLILIHVAMYFYDGGTIHQPQLDQYQFTGNFLSDLGRERLPNRQINDVSITFRVTMALTGGCIALFFLTIPSYFSSAITKFTSGIAAIMGIMAGICYIGIGNVPYDIAYWQHTYLVRTGFICFLLMVVFYTSAIFGEKKYPNRYAWIFILFGIILLIQIAVMLLGERSWRSPDALRTQVIAQKIVVYAEIFCMLIQTIGVHKRMKKNEIQ